MFHEPINSSPSVSDNRYGTGDQVLPLALPMSGHFGCLLATVTGYDPGGVRGGKPFFDVRSGVISARKINYPPRASSSEMPDNQI